jgi:SagB-type dehydrogenase family enzyme
MEEYRNFLKDHIRKKVDFRFTDQNMGVPAPPVEKPRPEGGVFKLPAPGGWKSTGKISLTEAVRKRKSVRKYTNESFTLEELSYILWACQGVRGRAETGCVKRTVPSAGCRHALETYIACFRVDSVPKAVYRFLPLSHSLVKVFARGGLEKELSEAVLGQDFVGNSAAAFIWTAVPYRMEWRYGEASHKVIALDAGHACQNLSLACIAAGAGSCPVAAYDQELSDSFVGADGKDEFVIYIAAAGKTGEY